MAKLSGQIQATQQIVGRLQSESQLFGSLKIPQKIMEKDYLNLQNKPQINSVILEGNKQFEDLGMREVTGQEMIEMIENIWR